MGIVNIGAGGTITFDSTDTVTFTASHTQGNGNSVTKTDALAMTVYMATGVIITVSGTGFIDIQGSRGAFVHFNSNAAQPKTGDWAYFIFTGSSTSNTMNWCILSNATHALIFAGHAPTAGKFRYIILNKSKTLGWNDDTASGSSVYNDFAFIKCFHLRKVNANGAIMNRWSVFPSSDATQANFREISRSCTFNDLYWAYAGTNSVNFIPAAGNTIVLNRLYADIITPFSGGHCKFGGAGTLTIADSILRGGDITLFSQASGIVNVNNNDITGGFGSGGVNEGVYGTTVTFDLDGNYIAGNKGFDISVVDTSTTTPTAEQHRGINTLINPQATPNNPREFTGIGDSGVGANGFTATATAGIICKSRILYGTASGVYTMATEWDAPDEYISEIDFTMPCIVSDWGGSGLLYDKSKSITLANLENNTIYYWVYEGIDPFGEKMEESAEQTTATTDPADTTAPVFAGGVSGVAASDNATDKSVSVSCNAATDAAGNTPVRYKYYIKETNTSPFAAPDIVKLLETNAATNIELPDNTLHSIGVRAMDSLSNETSDANFITVTPTKADTIQIGGYKVEMTTKSFAVVMG